MKYVSRRLSWLLPILLLVGVAKAQSNSEITGTVTDPSGAVVPHATVTVTMNATSQTHTATTDSAGLFVFPGLQEGQYTLVVNAPGFQELRRTGIVLNVAETLREDAHLVVGANNQTVTVQASALQVQLETNEVSTLITGKQITQIATNGRNVTSLTTLGTGVSDSIPSFNGVTAQGSDATISFNGMRPDHNDWLIDGAEVYDRGSGGKIGVLPTPDVLSQFQVLESNYSPDYGISSGGTVLMEIKSGANAFHGGVWEFNRNDAFDADNYFSKQSNTATPELRLNIFGGDVGGPVRIPHIYNGINHKTYFFWSEEWRRYIAGVSPTVTDTVPASDFPTAGTALTYTPFNNGATPVVPVTSDPAKLALYAADGLTPGQPFPGNTIPANLLDPNAVLMMSTGAIPHPNDGSDQYVASPKQPTYVREDVERVDQDIARKYHLMESWIHDAMSQTVIPPLWSSDSYDTVGSVFQNPSWGAVVKLSQTLSPNLLNETSFNINGNHIHIAPTGIYAQPSGWSASSFFPTAIPQAEMPQIGFSNGSLNTTYSMSDIPYINSWLDYQPRDDVSWTRGKHVMKFGFSYMREDKIQQIGDTPEGAYSFSGSQFSGDPYINFLLGFASSYNQLQNESIDHWLSNEYSFYAMDNWHVTPRLTLNLGFRYDMMPHTWEKNNRVSTFVPADFNMANAQIPSATTGDLDPTGPGFGTVNGASFYLNGIAIAGVGGTPRQLVKNDYFTPSPRLGFAYDVGGNGKTVVRGGVGIFYEKVQGNDIYDIDTTPPFAYSPSVNNVYFSNPGVSATNGAVAAVPTGPAGLTSISIYYPSPATAQYSLGVQQELAPSVVAAIQYVGSSGWNQDDDRGVNDLPLTDPANPANPYDEREAVATGGANGLNSNSNLYRTYPGFSNIVQEENATNTSYNSLQSALRMENRHGLTLQVAYTWSHEIDIESGDLGTVSNPYNIRYDRGSGTLDRRNIFNVNYIYALPFFQHAANGFARTALGGWELAGVTQAESGPPNNITYGGPDTLGLGGNTTNRPDVVAPVRFPKTQTAWFTTSSFANPVAPWNGGTNQGFGTARKDTITAPGLFNWNISLYKDFAFESNGNPRLELRAESYNAFNHTEWNTIDAGTTDSTYGQVTSTYDPRVFQFGAKFLF